MSRRKQSNPRQIKRSLGDMEEVDENLPAEFTLSEKDGTNSDPEESADCSSSSASNSDCAEGEQCSPVPQSLDQELEEPDPVPNVCELAEESSPSGVPVVQSPACEDSPTYKAPESPSSMENMEEPLRWNGPEELVLEIPSPDGVSLVRAESNILKGFSWGPYRGSFSGAASSPDRTDMNGSLSLEVDSDCWLKNLTLVTCELEANSVIYRKGDQIWCKTSQDLQQGDVLKAFLMAEPQAIPNFKIKEEPCEPSQETPIHTEFPLLPQQAGMASILATAVVNKDVFPCKDCGIWYRSERNLQAHLMYYCASRQSSTSPSVEEKPKDSYPNERICPFPQCKKSCPSASSLEIHMRSHSGERPFVCLICLSAFTTKANCERHLKVHTDTLNGMCHGCGFISTTRDILYSHLVTNHMICQPGSKVDAFPLVKTLPTVKSVNSAVNQGSSATLLKCSLCGFLADGLASLQQHALMHTTSPIPITAQSTQSPLGSETEQPPEVLKNGDSTSPASSLSGSEEPPLKVKIKEEPEPLMPITESGAASSDTTDAAALVPSPAVKIKTEISSPTPGSSPVPNESGAAAGGGTVIMPHYVFGHEAAPAIVPQASEILAKMSELVHSRLKQGQAASPAGFSGNAPPKGATCFECEITFNNINNYYVHKRLYCSGRHVAEESPATARKIKVTPIRATVAPGTSTLPAVDDQGTIPPQEEAGGESSAPVVSIKVEEGVGTESEPTGSGHVSEGSQSPSSLDDTDEDPTRTVCEACNIRFSRHDTYMVHKRYYCASRHDPPLRRPGMNKPGLPYTPQPTPRTRKRRKLYEIHGMPTAEVTPSALLSLNRIEVLPMIQGLITAPAVPSPSSSPDDADGPIDLSKKPRLLVDTPVPSPAAAVVPLTDYHECTACRISFNSLESYLAHKKFSCPVAPLQQKALQQLQKMKTAVNTAAKIGEDIVKVKVERRSPGSVNESTQSIAMPFTSIPDTKPILQYPTAAEASPSSTASCPYCPPNVVIRGDLLEHLRGVHGLLLAKATPGHRLQGTFTEVVLAARAQPGTASEGSLPSPPVSSASPLQMPRDNANSKDGSSSSSASGSPVSNCTPRPVLTSTPRPLLPNSPALPLNSLVETRKEDGLRATTLTLLPGDKAMQSPKLGLATPLPNGNHRYCRLCNIKFSSLSTFIAHKKYYCSSHAAEHVK
ncbi:zinc finger protein ZFPM1-like isoform X1 [Bufo gargarizans]|uniref:zinc finger protein ZFPM1-like isoform X1 n=2 Tax=Bufo gargarizans TaxID=30331 RepID=UPI001CF48F08|nr:zinc finger protein ZFPM1-like isoform X1 [Bufo gargarizans]